MLQVPVQNRLVSDHLRDFELFWLDFILVFSDTSRVLGSLQFGRKRTSLVYRLFIFNLFQSWDNWISKNFESFCL